METIQPYVIQWLVPTVLSGLLGYAVGLIRKMKAGHKTAEEKAEAEKRTDAEWRERMREDMDKLMLISCRMAVYDEHFSVDEKVDAYRIYRAKGGNHQTKKYMDELLGEDADAYLARH